MNEELLSSVTSIAGRDLDVVATLPVHAKDHGDLNLRVGHHETSFRNWKNNMARIVESELTTLHADRYRERIHAYLNLAKTYADAELEERGSNWTSFIIGIGTRILWNGVRHVIGKQSYGNDGGFVWAAYPTEQEDGGPIGDSLAFRFPLENPAAFLNENRVTIERVATINVDDPRLDVYVDSETKTGRYAH